MACCKCCCGGEDCAEGQEGKCCCGGSSGTCCQPGECCNGGVCGSCCVDCACTDSCVNFTFTHLGDLQVPDTPADVDYKSEMEADSCTDDNPSPCFEFGYLVGYEPQYADYTGACDDNDTGGNYTWFHSHGGEPYGRLRCLENGDFVFELCVFNVCSGTESSAGRLTKKTYAVTLGEDDCPAEIGSELSSEVSDLQYDLVAGEWEPLDETIDLDGEVAGSQTGQLWCNQDCWGEWPFDFVVGTVDGPDCNPLP
jgi:hypothetical protein